MKAKNRFNYARSTESFRLSTLALCFNPLVATSTTAAANASSLQLNAPKSQSGLIPQSGTAAVAIVPTNPPPRMIVMCREGTDLTALFARHQLQPEMVFDALGGFATPLSAAAIAALKQDPDVLCVEEDSNTVGLASQTTGHGLKRIGVDQFPVARHNGITEPIDVDVAVLDTGIDYHPDLTNVVAFYSQFTSDPSDEAGHGTAVAGVLGALDNDFGVVGVAPGVRIWNIKVANAANGNAWSWLISGMNYCYLNSNQISVANISLSNSDINAPASSLNLVINRMINAGIVVVTAAGNSSWDVAGPDGIFGNGDDALPGSLPAAMNVSGMDSRTNSETGLPNDRFYINSNFSQIERTNGFYIGGAQLTNYVISPGGAIDVVAPAVGITVLGTNGSYRTANGTSFAAPHVAGLVALYIAANGRATNAEGVYAIRQAIVNASLPQSLWHTNNTGDPDTNPEPLAMASEAWIPQPHITSFSGPPGAVQAGFTAVPGYDYTLQSTTNLTPPVAWSDVATHTGTNFVAAALLTDTNVAEQSFYRLHRHGAGTAPVILLSPIGWFKQPGETLNLGVSAIGTAPLSYFWHKDGAPLADGGTVSGAGTAALTVTNWQAADAGDYAVVVTNSFGSVTSAVATVVWLTNLSTSPVTGVVATATSEIGSPFFRWASVAVDGVTNGNYWESTGVNETWGTFGTDRSPAITFDLGAVRVVEQFEIWNAHDVGVAVKRMDVHASQDGVTFTDLGEFALSTFAPASEVIALGGVSARYVRFTAVENDAGQLFPVGGNRTASTACVAIEEVQFREYVGP